MFGTNLTPLGVKTESLNKIEKNKMRINKTKINSYEAAPAIYKH